jgi:hypothetical protein
MIGFTQKLLNVSGPGGRGHVLASRSKRAERFAGISDRHYRTKMPEAINYQLFERERLLGNMEKPEQVITPAQRQIVISKRAEKQDRPPRIQGPDFANSERELALPAIPNAASEMRYRQINQTGHEQVTTSARGNSGCDECSAKAHDDRCNERA